MKNKDLGPTVAHDRPGGAREPISRAATDADVSEMVERVAASIYAEDAEITLSHGQWCPGWDIAGENRKLTYRALARAAIAAMRTPSDAMVDAGCVALQAPEARAAIEDAVSAKHGAGVDHAVAKAKMRIRWTAMLDEAVK